MYSIGKTNQKVYAKWTRWSKYLNIYSTTQINGTCMTPSDDIIITGMIRGSLNGIPVTGLTDGFLIKTNSERTVE